MKICISVVSHGHLELLKKLNVLPTLAKSNKIKIKLQDNSNEDGLRSWCIENDISYEVNNKALGFGHNNNIIFARFKKTLSTLEDGYFIVLNPDVIISEEKIIDLIMIMKSNEAKIGAINLYKDEEFKESDNSIRNYPRLSDFFKSFLFNKNPSIIDKTTIEHPTFVQWAAGSFLCFSFEHYELLNGFDENYFMYCEDLDICYRSDFQYNCKVLYCPNIKAIHLAQHANRTIFSKHFIWHITSIFRYLIKRFLR